MPPCCHLHRVPKQQRGGPELPERAGEPASQLGLGGRATESQERGGYTLGVEGGPCSVGPIEKETPLAQKVGAALFDPGDGPQEAKQHCSVLWSLGFHFLEAHGLCALEQSQPLGCTREEPSGGAASPKL